MEIKIKLDTSFFIGLLAGTVLSLILVAAALGIILGASHLRAMSSDAPAPTRIEALSQESPSPAAVQPAAERPSGNVPAQGPDSAPVKLLEYVDFHCGFCRKAVPTIQQLLQKFPGKIKREFHHFPLSEVPGQGSFLTHEWSACAQEQGKFWDFHDAVFAIQQSPTPADLSEIARKIGLNQGQLDACVKSGKFREFIKQDKAGGAQKGITGTPTFFINDQRVAGAFPLEHFSGIVDSLLSGKPLPAAAAQRPPAPSVPPANVNFDDLEDRPSRGPKKAKITLVQFSDFHCPFCKKVEPTLQEIEKNFPGQVRVVWRHYPLPMHAGAEKTHQASECAFEQNKFWEYHGKLFDTLGQPRDEASLVKLAEDLKLNKSRFEKCLKSEKYKERVQKDIAKGSQSGVSGTPAVFVNGQIVEGAQPYQNFEQIIKNKLNGG